LMRMVVPKVMTPEAMEAATAWPSIVACVTNDGQSRKQHASDS
jgi:hypothetical protein